ncbi:beta-N-acetylhexosaminidase [Anaerobaca lacustris]|uniref:beta-N-acetylhexosaminidase n=1 Tax=Anaerobaca lacustris TaxID=3044600 RepID=A0AAW6TXX9_9BACT|nr:beta-N-acetylhexosaminidase [Sedimentisphaerales bacterium M17dextr]
MRRIATMLVAVVVLVLGAATCLASGTDGDRIDVIPRPVSVERLEGAFRITPSTCLVAQGPAAVEAKKLAASLAPAMGFSLELRASLPPGEKAIEMHLDEGLSPLGVEGYELRVAPERIAIVAAQPAGLFYGIQTLRQLLPAVAFRTTKVDDVAWDVPCVKITDRPRFAWRGLLLDPARHFIAKGDLLRFIDVMALHKFNRLQVHLTDNEGWRIEIKKYPRLTEIGSKMDWNLRHRDGAGPRCFGFYTQDDIRQIVRYAADRHVTVVPEIEMPFHTGAAIVAHPELGIAPGRLALQPPEQRWRETSGLIAPRPETVAFFQDVLTEVMELFPSKHIHIGGDEANINLWTNDPEMQVQMTQLQLKDAHELHSWFIKQMDAFLSRHGRRLVGWDEILQGGLAPGATVMSWRGEQGGIAAANAGHDVVMAPTTHTYLDYYQGPPESEPLAIGGNLPLAKVYSYDPIPEAIAPDKAHHVLGVQAQLWGEYIATPEHLNYMAYPRAAALAEVGWFAKEAKDYEQFVGRLRHHIARLKALGVDFRPLD